MSEQTLKPCPFCGPEGVVYMSDETLDEGDRWRIRCEACWTETDAWGTPDLAVAQWHTRPIENALRAEVERLTRELERLRVQTLCDICKAQLPIANPAALAKATGGA